ncbi:hypothetical protein MBLNU457_g0147t1 [Dothideomycetes sp. NU457]
MEPQERGINAQEEGKTAAQRRAADHGSTKAMEGYQRKAQVQAQERASRPAVETVEVPAPDIIQMKVEVFVRPAAAKDASQISDILKSHNRLTHYPTPSEITVAAVTELISDCQREALPFLVAVKRLPHHTKKPDSTIGRRRIAPEDEVYGVAFASSRQPVDIALPSTDTTAYLEFYVRSDVCNKGVGSALLDTALSILIPVPYYFASTGGPFAVSPEAVLGWKKKVSEVQMWLRSTGTEPDSDTSRVITWLKTPRWGFEVLDDVKLGEDGDGTAARVTRLRRRVEE